VKGKSKLLLPETKVILILLLVSAAILGSLIWDWLRSESSEIRLISGTDPTGSQNPHSPTSASISPESSSTADVDDLIPVYLVGAIQNPGIYRVAKGSYLYELVTLAGGLSENAAVEQINLAFRIDTNQMIRLPSLDEVGEGNSTTDPGIYPSESGSGLVDINQATLDQLDSLPGVGPSTAQAIISYREKNGPFAAIEELMKIPGIKESRFNALKDLICVSE
jgi:competence protein ComEA